MSMPLGDDGNVIKALGYVALYCAYLEEDVDHLLQALGHCAVPMSPKVLRSPTSRKIKFCREAIQPHVASNQEMADLDGALQYAAERLEERNDVIHGRIYGSLKKNEPDMRRSGRPGVPDKPATSEELYALANNVHSVLDTLMHGYTFSVFRAFKRDGAPV